MQTLDEMRASDGELPFSTRLRTRAQEWAQTSGMQLQLDMEEIFSLSPKAEDALLRITDEALANVLRHSGADHGSLALRHDADKLWLTIADNGQGASEDARPGMGLSNMRERAQALPQGQFEFDSGSGQGSRIRISFSSV